MSSEKKVYRIIKHQSNLFVLDMDGTQVLAKTRKKIKAAAPDGKLLVGDYVTVDNENGETVIAGVEQRINSLVRPAIANVELIVIVVAPIPQVDYYLVDKLIVHCAAAGIECAICYNKTDIKGSEATVLKSQYRPAIKAIVSASALTGDVEALRTLIEGKLTCFAGQSAVGKSSLTNCILGGEYIKTGEVSVKSQRGKNTTTAAEIFRVGERTYIADTPGFSMLDTAVSSDDLALYYPEFEKYMPKCKFNACTHTVEPDCAVRTAAENGRVNNERYVRYKRLFDETKRAERRNRTSQ